MLAAILFFGVLALVALGSYSVFARILCDLDRLEPIGICGLIGMIASGWITFVLLWAGFGVSKVVIFVLAAVSIAVIARNRNIGSLKFRGSLWLAAIIPLLFVGLVQSLVPPDTMEWDSLAYHLAVPKIWLHDGAATYLQTIHHSNFPSAMEALMMSGLSVAEPAAKVITLAGTIFGLLAIFGFVRRKSSTEAAWIAAAAYMCVPLVIWESGSGYIDAVHGLFSGFCLLYCGEFLWTRKMPFFWLACLCAACACATKYTGLQTVAVATILLLGFSVVQRDKEFWKMLLLPAIAMGVMSPWLVRNMHNTGNPVYPFFDSVFHSQNWSPWQSEIYTFEQKSFGVGTSATSFPHAVLGLSYQPGRYINPYQTHGGGFPTGAIGAIPMVSVILWLLYGDKRHEIQIALLGSLLSFGMWFFLSQQSRYALGFVPISCVCVGLLPLKSVWSKILAALIAFQSAYSLYLFKEVNLVRQLPVVLGQMSREEYLDKNCAFAPMAKIINEQAQGGKVALYEQVFGYLLDVPYVWANPGHSRLFSFSEKKTAEDLLKEYKANDITHVYLYYRLLSPEEATPWKTKIDHYSQELLAKMQSDENRQWLAQIYELYQANKLVIVQERSGGILFKVQ